MRRLGAAFSTGRLVAPLLLPTLSNGLLTAGGTSTGTGDGTGGRIGAVAVNPILNLQHNLTSRSAQPVLTYTTECEGQDFDEAISQLAEEEEDLLPSRPALRMN